MTLKQKSNIIASIGTLVALLLLFLLLWFVYMGAPVLPEDEGIEVAFGDVREAGGFQPESEHQSMPMESVTPPPAPSKPTNNDLMTQEDEETLAVQRQRDKEEKARKEAEAERLRQEKAKAAQAEAARIAKEKALAEQKAKEQAAKDKAAAMGSLFGNNAAGAQGTGDSKGEGQKGNPVAGYGTSGGNSWFLEGRSIKGALPEPKDKFNQDGKVVVSIWVLPDGTVKDAQITRGTTISDKSTLQLALNAARKAKFSESDKSIQTGTITYNFKFH